MNYLEGFYKGDTAKPTNSLKPTLYKFVFWKIKNTGAYESKGFMMFEEAIKYAQHISESKIFVSADAPKKVEILDIMYIIASAKSTAWCGVDYALLSKTDGKWMIEQVIWEDPLEN